MNHAKNLVVMLALVLVAAVSIGATTASAELDYTGPIAFEQIDGVLESEDGTELVCGTGEADGAISSSSLLLAHGDLSYVDFSSCLVFGFIGCTVDVTEPLELAVSAIDYHAFEFHLDSAVEVSRVCPLVGTCHYDAAPNAIEGVYSEAANTLEFNGQPLSGPCGEATWSAEFELHTPTELHWDW